MISQNARTSCFLHDVSSQKIWLREQLIGIDLLTSLTNRHEPFAMIADILKEDVASSRIPRTRQETQDYPSTHCQLSITPSFCGAHAKTITPLYDRMYLFQDPRSHRKKE